MRTLTANRLIIDRHISGTSESFQFVQFSTVMFQVAPKCYTKIAKTKMRENEPYGAKKQHKYKPATEFTVILR